MYKYNDILPIRNNEMVIADFSYNKPIEIMKNIELDNMPSNVEKIKYLEKENRELRKTVQELIRENAELRRENAELRNEIQELRNEVATLKQYIHQRIH